MPPTPLISAAEARTAPLDAAVLQIAPPDCLTLLPAPCHALLLTEGRPGREWRAVTSLFGEVLIPGCGLPVPCDPDWYCRSYAPPPELAGPRPPFRFYTAADSSPRKNLVGLLAAFFLAFRPGDGVELVVRTNDPAVKPLVERAAEEGGYRATPPVRVVSRPLKPAEGAGLATACDCYVTASRAEIWDLDALDAALFGRTPIAPDQLSYWAFLGGENPAGFLVRTAPEPCGPRRLWEPPVLTELAAAMTAAVADADARVCRADAGRALADLYSYEVVGRDLRGLLCRNKT